MRAKKTFDINPLAHLTDFEIRKLIRHWDEISGFRRKDNKLNKLKQQDYE